jgi:hypothetical protein
MSLIYGRQRENRTDYLEVFWTAISGIQPLMRPLGLLAFCNGTLPPLRHQKPNHSFRKSKADYLPSAILKLGAGSV